MNTTDGDEPGVGDVAPDFSLPTVLSGELVRLSDLRGRHVILFWVREFT